MLKGTPAALGALRVLPILLTLSVALAILFSWTYDRVNSVLELPLWTGSLLVNSVVAFFYLGFTSFRRLYPLGALRQIFAVIPALAIALGAVIIIFASPSVPVWDEIPYLSVIAMVLVVPIAEELCFRGALTSVMTWFVERRYLAGYFSAVVFAFLHGQLSLSGMREVSLGVPLGPFLLGISCELLSGLTGNLFASVLLHIACNGAVAALAVWAPDLLQWITGLL